MFSLRPFSAGVLGATLCSGASAQLTVFDLVDTGSTVEYEGDTYPMAGSPSNFDPAEDEAYADLFDLPSGTNTVGCGAVLALDKDAFGTTANATLNASYRATVGVAAAVGQEWELNVTSQIIGDFINCNDGGHSSWSNISSIVGALDASSGVTLESGTLTIGGIQTWGGLGLQEITGTANAVLSGTGPQTVVIDYAWQSNVHSVAAGVTGGDEAVMRLGKHPQVIDGGTNNHFTCYDDTYLGSLAGDGHWLTFDLELCPAIASPAADSNVGICPGGSVELTGSLANGTANIQWFKNGAAQGSPQLGVASTSYTANGPGVYHFTATAGDCTETSKAYTVFIDNAPPQVIAGPFVSPDPPCAGSSVTLSVSANNADTIKWFQGPLEKHTGSTYTFTLGASTAGDYYARVFNECGDFVDSPPVTVAAASTQILNGPIVNKTPACFGDAITLSISVDNATSIVWEHESLGDQGSGASFSFTMGFLQQGLYRARITGPCTGAPIYSDWILVGQASITGIPTVDPAGPLCAGASFELEVTAENETSIDWYREDGANPDVLVGSGNPLSLVLSSTYPPDRYYPVANPTCQIVPFFTVDVLQQDPTIVAQPVGASGCEAGSATFDVEASGAGTIAFAWYGVEAGTTTLLVDGSTYLGAAVSITQAPSGLNTLSTLELDGLDLGLHGTSYYALVSDGCAVEPVTTNSVNLTVSALPAISNWIGADGNDWEDPASWSGCGVPYGQALLSNAGGPDNEAIVSGMPGIDRATVGGGGGAQKVRIEAGGALEVTTSLDILANGEVELDGGSLDLGDGASSGALDIQPGGILSGSGDVNDADITNRGLILAGTLLDLGAGDLVNCVSGTIDTPAGCELRSDSVPALQAGTLTLGSSTGAPGARATFTGGLRNVGQVDVGNFGQLTVGGSGIENGDAATTNVCGNPVVGPVLFEVAANALVVSTDFFNEVGCPGGVPDVTRGVGMTGGEIELDSGSVFENEPGGLVHGYGVIDADVSNDGCLWVFDGNMDVFGFLHNVGITMVTGFTLSVDSYGGAGSLFGSCWDVGAGNSCGGAGPPSVLDVRDDFIADAAGSISFQDGRIEVGRNWDVAIDDPDRIQLSQASLQLDGIGIFFGAQQVESISHDFGPIDNLDITALNAIGNVSVGPNPAIVELVDAHDNAGDGSSEIFYAKTLTVVNGAALDLQGATLRVQDLILEPGATLLLSGGEVFYETMDPVDICDGSVAVDDCSGVQPSPPQDCDANGVADAQEIALGLVADCNENGVPDACDLALGFALDLDGNGMIDECQSFSATPASISLSAGGVQSMSLDAGQALASHAYLVLGSSSGSGAGFPLNGHLIPLIPDNYFVLTIKNANQFLFADTFGALDSEGRGSAAISVPPGFQPGLAGLQLHHAFVALDPLNFSVQFASNAMPLDLVP